jgi:hypothetical protein
MWLAIAIGLWSDSDIPAIWRQVIGTLRALQMVSDRKKLPCKSALSQARTRLGAGATRQLFVQTARPIAQTPTRGAFYKGMRLMGIDGVALDTPDTTANAAAFGRPSTCRDGQTIAAAYPKIHVILLAEIGTHMIHEAFAKRAKTSEFPSVSALLKRVPPGSLVLEDRGFYGYKTVAEARRRKIHILGRVPNHVLFDRQQTLADGSYLATIYPTTTDRRRQTNGLIVRVIEYTIDDTNRPGHGERHRLVTTLFEADAYPALELISLYHERWEIELGNDELKTHQLNRLVHLRSRTPNNILQELYGILIAYNAVRFFMHDAAISVDIDPRRLSFIHAVRVIRETAPLMRAAPTPRLASLYAAMIQHIAEGRLPPRDNRINPRVVKRKMSNFPQKRAQHARPPQPQTSFLRSVVIIK